MNELTILLTCITVVLVILQVIQKIRQCKIRRLLEDVKREASEGEFKGKFTPMDVAMITAVLFIKRKDIHPDFTVRNALKYLYNKNFTEIAEENITTAFTSMGSELEMTKGIWRANQRYVLKEHLSLRLGSYEDPMMLAAVETFINGLGTTDSGLFIWR